MTLHSRFDGGLYFTSGATGSTRRGLAKRRHEEVEGCDLAPTFAVIERTAPDRVEKSRFRCVRRRRTRTRPNGLGIAIDERTPCGPVALVIEGRQVTNENA